MSQLEVKEFEVTRGPDQDDPLSGEPLDVNMGPQHPATHGVLRLKVRLDGETMHEIEPVVGYLHRGKEKTCESLGWRKFFVHTDRLDYVQPLMNNIGYAMALEKLGGVELPQRAREIRMLIMELNRIMAHLIYIGTTGIDLGAVTIFFYSFKQREWIYNLLDSWSGHRMHHAYIRVGGVYADIEEQHEREIREFIDQFPAAVDEMANMLTTNRIWYDRNKDVGVINKEQALAWSLTGPNLRGSGVEYDLRKAEPYCGYETYDFEVPTGSVGDCYDRYLVRMEEMRQSCAIAKQALERIGKSRGGEWLAEDRRYVLPPKQRVRDSMEELIYQFKIVTDMALPKGEAYVPIESSKGELGFFVVSDGTSKPQRCYIRSPGLMNVQVIPLAGHGHLLSDMMAIIGSLDFVMGEVDK